MQKIVFTKDELINVVRKVLQHPNEIEDLRNSIEDLTENALNRIDFKVTGLDYIAAERQRQIEVEGYDSEHDSKYYNNELGCAAICYLVEPDYRDTNPFPWPWDENYWKPTPEDRTKELSKAGALTAGQIDIELNKEK